MGPFPPFTPGAITPIEARNQNVVFFEDQWKSATCQECGYYAPIGTGHGQCRFFEWRSEDANLLYNDDPACPRFEPHGRPVEINNHDDD